MRRGLQPAFPFPSKSVVHHPSDSQMNRWLPLFGLIAIVPRDLVIEEAVFHARPSADVVNDQRIARSGRQPVGDDADVRQVSRQHPGHQIARQIVARIAADRQRLALAERPRSGAIAARW